MATTRQQLHALVDMVDELGLDTLYNVMIRFIPEDEPAPDEVEAINLAIEAHRRGETIRLEDLNLT